MKNNFYLLRKRETSFSMFVLLFMTIFSSYGQTIISSVAELAEVVGKSNQNIVMQAGVYDMGDYLTTSNIDSKTPEDAYNRKAMMRFSGSNNTFDFTGVTINIPTSLLKYIGRGTEFQLTGSNINLKGLTLTNTGNSLPANPGITLMTVTGDYNTLENVTLNVAGSSPYGYGDLLGKGGKKLVGMKKHSGMIVEGLDCKFLSCSVYSKAFGHLIAIQGGRNVYFQDCHVEAVTRTTDEMLAETSGLAYGVNFASVWPNYDGDNVITPGYTKSLSEDGYRTYGSGATGVNTSGVTLVNCTAKNVRVAFALEYGGPILIQNCEATGCEGGYNVTDATIENSRGDAVNGPLLYLTGGSNSNIELALMSTLPTTTLHAIATIAGNNHNVTLTKWQNQTRTQNHKILLGATRPTAVNPFSPIGTGSASGVTLNNCTGMPIEVYSSVSSSSVNSNGTVDNNGSNNSISYTDDCEEGVVTTCDVSDAYSTIQAECYNDSSENIQVAGGLAVGYIENGSWVKYEDIDFDNGASSIEVSAASGNAGGDIEIRKGSNTGELLGTVAVENTGSWTTWKTFSADISSISGVQDIYLVFTGDSGYLLDVNWLTFAEEEEEEVVTNDENLALNGTATQSSLDHGGNPERAIDGNTNGNWTEGSSVTHTASETNPWWQVDLGSDTSIGDINIYNRTDNCCSARLTNFTVSVINSRGTITYSKTYTTTPNPSVSLNAENAIGSIVKVQLNGSGNPLSLAEVEVFEGEITTTTDTTNTITLQENATGFCAVDGTIDSNHAGYTGSGFANTANANGNAIDWKISGDAGEYTFEWGYASTSNRSAALLVNGSTVASTISFNATGSWASWDTESVTVTLSAGVKEIRLEATNGSGLVNVDYMEVTGQNVSAVDCNSEEGETDCAGVVGGTATIDACGICSGGTTGVSATSPQTWYADADGDGAGDPDTSVEQCSQPNGYVSVAGDICPNDANKNEPGDCGCGEEEGTCSSSDCNNTTALIEAECYDDMEGVVIEPSNGLGENLGYLADGDWARYNDIDVSGINTFYAQLSTLYSGRSIEIRLDSENGTLVGTLSVPNTGAWHDYANASTTISNLSGTHDIFLVFRGGSFNIGSFGFEFNEIVESTDCSSFYGGLSISQRNPGCSNNDGAITVGFNNSSSQTQIQISLNGGSSYPVTVNDNSGSYTFTGLSVEEFEVAVKYTDGSCEFNVGTVNLVPDCGDIDLNPGGVSWHDSYEANGFCWCSTNFDHDLDDKEVTINGTRYNVVDVCDELEDHPLFRNRNSGDAIYNDVQCGNGPLNDSSDEPICPGRVDNGADDCLVIGVRWDMEWLASRDRFGGSSNKDIATISDVDYEVYPNPVINGAEVTIASDSNVVNAKLYDINGEGELIDAALLNGNKIAINTGAPGFYFLQILFEDGSIQLEKLIVK